AQEYVMNDNDFSRTNVQANLESELFTGLTIGTQLRGRLEKHITTAETATSDPITVHFKAIQSTWPHENWYANNNPNYVNGDVRYLIRSPAIMNRSILGTQDQIRTNIAANFFAEYVFPFGLTAKATYSRTSDLEEFDGHRYSYDAYCYDAGTDTYNVCDSSQGQIRRHIRDV